jgi:hypothetical protein
MNRRLLPATMAAVAAVALLAALGGPAHADVVSSLQTAGTNMITWVRAGAIIVFIAMGCLIIAGFRNIVAFGAAIVGLAIAIQPEVLVAWIG